MNCLFCNKLLIPENDYCSYHKEFLLYYKLNNFKILKYSISIIDDNSNYRSTFCINYLNNTTEFFLKRIYIKLPYILNVSPDNYKSFVDKLLALKAFS